MHNIGDAFVVLVHSTHALHARFGTAQTVDQALARLNEEINEVTDAALMADATEGLYAAIDDITQEAADVIVTVLGVLRVFEVTDAELAAALLAVAHKNNAKTHATHYVRDDGKIARRDA